MKAITINYFGVSSIITRRKKQSLSFDEEFNLFDLVNFLTKLYGSSLKNLFFDKDNEFKPLVMLLINGKPVEDYNYIINSKDEISITPLIAGG